MDKPTEAMFIGSHPWTGISKDITGATNINDALKKANLDWQVLSKDVFVEGKQISEYRANVRNTDDKVLGIVSNRYQIIQNNEAFAFTESLLAHDVQFETMGMLRGGKQIWLEAKLEPQDILGDEVIPYLVFTNSHDGNGSVRVCMTPIRVICINTLNLAFKKTPRIWTTRHVGNLEGKQLEAQQTLELAITYMDELSNEAEKLAKIKVDDLQLQKFIDKVIPFPELKGTTNTAKENVEMNRQRFRNALNVDNLADFKNTAWGVVNAIADWSQHTPPKRITERSKERQFEEIINGSLMLDRSYALLTA